LRKGLEKRPEKEELIERTRITMCLLHDIPHFFKAYAFNPSVGNILPDSTATASLQGKQKELEKHMRADSLEHKIQQRPRPEELVKEGILGENENPLKES